MLHAILAFTFVNFASGFDPEEVRNVLDIFLNQASRGRIVWISWESVHVDDSLLMNRVHLAQSEPHGQKLLRCEEIQPDEFQNFNFSSDSIHAFIWQDLEDFFNYSGEAWPLEVDGKIPTYILVGLEDQGSELKARFEETLLKINSRLFLLLEGSDSVSEVYKMSVNGDSPGETPVILAEACTNGNASHVCDPDLDIWERRSDFNGTRLRAVMQPFPPFSFYEKLDSNKNDSVKASRKPLGIFPDIFRELQKVCLRNRS